jgi:4-methoxybenzoate monooxygenase (O-demethylating)
MTTEAYVSHDDLFNAVSVRDARAVDDKIRELAPVVKLGRENITLLGRYEHVAAGLRDWKTFSSTSRPWHDPKSVRPELLLTDDPPKHTRVRAAISAALSPQVLGKMADAFRVDADALVMALKEKSGATVDAVAQITQAFVYKVLPDLLGIPSAGREHLYAFGNMVWATMGPMNELYDAAMKDTSPVIEWATCCVERRNLAPGSLGMHVTFVYLSAGVMESNANIERFQRLSDIAISAAL